MNKPADTLPFFRPSIVLSPLSDAKQKKQKEMENDWARLVNEYLKKYKKQFDLDEEESKKGLVFSSREDAVQFFTNMATQGLLFLLAEYKENKPTGFFLYSCGDGKLYQGSLRDIKKELEQVIKQSPSEHKKEITDGLAMINQLISPTHSMRAEVKNVRENEEAPVKHHHRP